ncbi:MAG TPA: YsnF/AvaK domain-containing protein [Pyrinomonadaceae bacterium]
MALAEDIIVFDTEGVRGTLEAPFTDVAGNGRARVLLADGRKLWLPPGALERQDHGTLIFRGSFDELAGAADGGGQIVVPVVAEELRVGKRVVETGRVRVTKTVHEHEEVVDQPLLREEYDVERVTVDEFVDGPVGPRYEGETLVVPVLEEVLVVEKRLVVREELRITRKRTEERNPQRVKLLSEEVSVERADADAARGDSEESDGAGVRSHAAPHS